MAERRRARTAMPRAILLPVGTFVTFLALWEIAIKAGFTTAPIFS